MKFSVLSPRLNRNDGQKSVTDDLDAAAQDADATAESANTEASVPAGTAETDDDDGNIGSGQRRNGIRWGRVLAYGILPGLAMVLVLAAGYLKWYCSSAEDSQLAGIEALEAARDGGVAMLSYAPDTAERELGAARDRLTGALKESYTSLTRDMVIPGAAQRKVTSVVTVPAAASVSATPNHAVVLMFVNQTITIGSDPPTNSASRVRVILDKVGDRWLIAGFDPI